LLSLQNLGLYLFLYPGGWLSCLDLGGDIQKAHLIFLVLLGGKRRRFLAIGRFMIHCKAKSAFSVAVSKIFRAFEFMVVRFHAFCARFGKRGVIVRSAVNAFLHLRVSSSRGSRSVSATKCVGRVGRAARASVTRSVWAC
jgi:hypothetical protein